VRLCADRIGRSLIVLLCFEAPSVGAIAGSLDTIVVTATRIAEPLDRIPADISVVSANELGARDVWDMASAVSLVTGVDAPPGGDAGPSSAVPSFWGLHEFDAFLLVVDGIPWGGAFNPAISTLNFTDIKRVEILKGAGPVMYGATSFVGVVQAIHYPAGEAADEADLAFGSYGSVRGSASIAFASVSDYRQSLALDGQRLGFADARERVSDGHVLYRGESQVGTGKLRVDADVAVVDDVPPSPAIRAGTALNTLTPINANFNPADGKIEENKFHVDVGYTQPVAAGVWESLISFAYSDIKDIRAFLHPDLSGSADTQNQRRHIDDGYFDTHLTRAVAADTSLIVGGDLLYGRGRQRTLNGNSVYVAPLDGSLLPPPTTALPVNEIGNVDDTRLFAGQYAQVDWKPDDRWDLLAGVRVNETYERKVSSDETLPPPDLLSARAARTVVRPSETIGVSYRAAASGKDEAVAYADFRNAFKPAAIDFGPDYTPDLLSPETAHSYEAGLKGTAMNGRLNYQGEVFAMDFNNLVVRTSSGALANAAEEKLKGVELETRYQLQPDLALAANASYHDARFKQYFLFDAGTGVDVSGRQLPLSPRVLASAGLLYTPESGFGATVVGRYVGRRFLDAENTATVGGYTALDATLSYRVDKYRLTLEATNLTDRRPPVSASEFGSESFYLLPARMLWVRLSYQWRSAAVQE
jgi:iron complex outermembrane receptor protein